MDWLVEPLNYEFMRSAIATGILIGILCPVVGSFLIVQRMAMLGEVVAHAVIPGLAIAFFWGMNILLGAFIWGLLSSLLIAWIRSQSRVKVDTAMAIVLSSFLALGVLLITLLQSTLDLHGFLFGDILGVTPADVWRTFGVALVVLLLVKLFYKELLFYTFDRLGAQALGLPVNLIYFGLMTAVTLAIIASMQTVGALLVVSLLIGPGATAYLLVKELHLMMGLGAIFGAVASVSGMYISYYLDVPSGPAIVLVVFGLFLAALLFSPSQGVLTRSQAANRLIKTVRRLGSKRR